MQARGIRNKNPFNLLKTSINWRGKIKGNDTRFETFVDFFSGVRAGMIDVIGDIFKDGDNTLVKLINRFAPPHENDTNAYIRFVRQRTGISTTRDLRTLTPVEFELLAMAINAKENGKDSNAVPLSDIKKGVDAALVHHGLKKKVIT